MRERRESEEDDHQNETWIVRQAERLCQCVGSKCPMQDGEGQKGKDRRLHDALEDMSEFIMAEFVGEHGKDLIAGVFLEKRVEEDDALRLTETRKISIAVRGALRSIH